MSSYDVYMGSGSGYGAAGILAGYSIVILLISLAVSVFLIVCNWKIFEKAGRRGWEAIAPIWNVIVMFKIVYGEQWMRVFLLLVPFVNIVISIMYYFDWAKAFGRSTGFGFGLMLLNVVFAPMLAFGSAEYVGPVD